jgi:hypothetical protein
MIHVAPMQKQKLWLKVKQAEGVINYEQRYVN